MQFSGVTFDQVKDVAAYHNMRAIPAYASGKRWVGACLRPTRSTPYRRISASSYLFGPERQVNAVCWCGHRRFLQELFARYPEAVVITSSPQGRVKITAGTLDTWLEKSISGNVGNYYHYIQPTDLCRHRLIED